MIANIMIRFICGIVFTFTLLNGTVTLIAAVTPMNIQAVMVSCAWLGCSMLSAIAIGVNR